MDQDTMKGLEWLGSLNDDAGEISQARTDIETNMPNWGTGWAATEEGREWLFFFLDNDLKLETASGTRRTLLDELDTLADEVTEAAGEDTTSKITDWFKTLRDEVGQSLELRCSQPEFSDPYGMWYWYDPTAQEYWYHADENAPPWQWLTQAEADEQVRSAEEVAGPAREGEAGFFSEAVWDENWTMFYRVGADGVYEYAYSSDSSQTGTPVEPWLTYDQASQEAAAAEAPQDAAAGPAGTETGPAARTREEAAAGVVDVGLLGLRQVGEQAPEIARLLAQLPEEELDLLLGQAITEGAVAAGVPAAA